MHSIATAIPALHAAGLIGVWNTNVAIGRSEIDEGAAALLAGDSSLAGKPIPLEVALRRIHLEDKDWVFERIRRLRLTGGPFSAEFRVLASSGEIRWVLNRGVLKRDNTGVMYGMGAYIDTTDSHGGTFISAASLNEAERDPLVRAADLCLEAHDAIKLTGDAYLRLRAEQLLKSIGQALAQRRS